MSNTGRSIVLSLAALVGLGNVGCQAASDPESDNGTAAAQTVRAVPIGGVCTASSDCANDLECSSNICMPREGLFVKVRCKANKAARVTLMERDPDVAWIGDGPPPAPSYSTLFVSTSGTDANGGLAWFAPVDHGTYILVMDGDSGTKQTDEFEYDGTPTLLEPTYDGSCWP